ncbi:retrovirus-related pol polyprotein from transposon TNT 1-94 [Tanacetum coccineum]
MMKAEDIENMTIAGYMEYEAELKKQSRRNARVSHLKNYEGMDLESSHHKNNIVLEYPHYSYDAKIDTYYDLPPLLPCFQPVQPHTNYDHKPPYADVKSVMDSMVTYESEGEKKDMTNLGASVNVIPKSMFEFLKLTHLKKTDMLVEIADMTKEAIIVIVENILVKIDKFLFPSDFVVIDMLDERNKTMILGSPFLATIYVNINVFKKEISLGVGEDRITFDLNKKIYNFTTHVEKIHMINSKHDGEPCKVIIPPYKAHVCLEIKGHNILHDQNNSIPNNEDMQGRCGKKARINKTDPVPKVHICRPVKQDCDETFKIWPTCDPTRKV